MSFKVIERIQGTSIDWIIDETIPSYSSVWFQHKLFDPSIIDVDALAASLQTSTGIEHRSGNPPSKPSHP